MALAAYLKHHMKLYVVFLWDVIHETVNSVDRALQKCKLGSVVQEILLAWKLPWGPWSNLSFHSKIRSAAKAFSEIAKGTCDSFFLWMSEKAIACKQALYLYLYMFHSMHSYMEYSLTLPSFLSPFV